MGEGVTRKGGDKLRRVKFIYFPREVDVRLFLENARICIPLLGKWGATKRAVRLLNLKISSNYNALA
jgi:hypothetical protein